MLNTSRKEVYDELMRKKVKGWKKIVVAGTLTASLGLGFWASKAFYEVKEVVDGDTFITKEGQYIRLDSVNAPELNLCLGKEAKEELSKLILNKKVYVKVRFMDNYKRLIGSVYTTKGNIGEIMVSKGMATYLDKGLGESHDLYLAAKKAREARIGVYSPVCTQDVNQSNPKCNIKGNVSEVGNLYRYPDCGQYNNTLVQLYFGGRWFCTESEAQNAGFAKGNDCR